MELNHIFTHLKNLTGNQVKILLVLSNTVTQQQVANITGLRREHVCRNLKQMEQKDILQIQHTGKGASAKTAYALTGSATTPHAPSANTAQIQEYEKELELSGFDAGRYKPMGTKAFVSELFSYINRHHCLKPANYHQSDVWSNKKALGLIKRLGQIITPAAFPTIMAYVNRNSGFKDMDFVTILYHVNQYFDTHKR